MQVLESRKLSFSVFPGLNGLERFYVTYPFDELLISLCSTLVKISCLKFDFSLHRVNTVRKSKLQRKQLMRQKQGDINFHLSLTLMLNLCLFINAELDISK